MTEAQTAAPQPEPDENDDNDKSYDLALCQKQRCAGFAFMLESVVEHNNYVDCDALEGVVRLAHDIAEKAEQLYECVRQRDLGAYHKREARQ